LTLAVIIGGPVEECVFVMGSVDVTAEARVEAAILLLRLDSGMDKIDLVKYWESSAFLDQV
jgi:hypothetical protein